MNKIQNLKFLFLTGLVMNFVTCSVFGQTNFDWPGFLGPDRNSKSGERNILKDWSGGKMKVAWSVDVGNGYCLGSVSKGLFFQFDSVDNQCRLICRDLESGEEKWKFQYEFKYQDMYGFDDGPRATPLIDGDRVFIYGVTGRMHCLSTKTGKVVWEKNLSETFGVVQNFFGVGSSPIIQGQFLAVMVGGSPANFQGTNRLDQVKPNRSAVVVLDKMSGKVVHKLGQDLASYSSVQKYFDSKGQALGVAWLREKVIGFDFATGEQKWEFPYRARKYESVNASTPVVDGEKIFLCESYGKGSLLLNVSDGKPAVVWRDTDRRNQALATHWNTPVLHDGYLYACHGERRATCEIRCVKFITGEVKWKKRGYSRSSITYVDEHLVILDEQGELILVKASPEKFDLVSKYEDKNGLGLPLEYPCWAAPMISNGKLLVRGKSKIFCLSLNANTSSP